MEKIVGIKFDGERALYAKKNVVAEDCEFYGGESPIKECENVAAKNCVFKWRYPLWYGKNLSAENCVFNADTRAGAWYDDGITVKNSEFFSPKNFRRCRCVDLENVKFTGGEETLWFCDGVKLKGVTAEGDYFMHMSENIEVENLTLRGKYSFDGVKNARIRGSVLLTKDAFWNSENVTVTSSRVIGEYLGWNSKNLTLIDCEIESLQGMCYIENLRLINCTLKNTSLAFEYCTVEADISSEIDSVFNPRSGYIKAEKIGELIVEKDKVDETKTKIICKNIIKKSDKPEWL